MIVGGILAFAMIAPSIALAATVTVTPTSTVGWSTADTRPGGAVNYVIDATSPYPGEALQLTTDATTTAKAQYLHATNTAIGSVTDLGYYTKQVAGPAYADPSYQLLVDLNGSTTGGFTTFVYEPYQNGTVTNGTWQQWDVDAGQFWSSRSFSEGTCVISAGGGGAPFYTLAGLKTMCPDAEVVGFGVNIGTNNPSYDVYTDGVAFNGTIYDFERYISPTDKDQCKKNGYKSYTDDNGNSFKNQGQCKKYVNHHTDHHDKKDKHDDDENDDSDE